MVAPVPAATHRMGPPGTRVGHGRVLRARGRPPGRPQRPDRCGPTHGPGASQGRRRDGRTRLTAPTGTWRRAASERRPQSMTRGPCVGTCRDRTARADAAGRRHQQGAAVGSPRLCRSPTRGGCARGTRAACLVARSPRHSQRHGASGSHRFGLGLALSRRRGPGHDRGALRCGRPLWRVEPTRRPGGGCLGVCGAPDRSPPRGRTAPCLPRPSPGVRRQARVPVA